MVATRCEPLQAHSERATKGTSKANFIIMVNPVNCLPLIEMAPPEDG